MKRFLTLCALVAIASSASAALTYKFQSSTSGGRSSTIAGTVAVDGSRLRMDIASGDGMLLKDNSVVLSNDGGKTMSVFDASTKNYFDFQIEQLLSSSTSMLNSLGGMVKIDFKNPQVNVQDAGDGGTIEGYPTRKYVLSASYDIDIDAMGQKMTMHSVLNSENWMTERLSSEATSFIQTRGLRTGIDVVDKIIEAQTSSMKGFPLKQVATVKVNDMTITTTSSVNNIQRRDVDPSQFAAPDGYTKVDDPITKMIKQMKQ
ncbi:MAG TPA: DUF4412 domain-containing protein [Thermoanaerobaculia bacterium]|nr:DUF4412 domain-containing protein [Thermoanaerobaculia bacterium]